MKADQVEEMSENELNNLKCTDSTINPKYNKTVKEILNHAVKQLTTYVDALKIQDKVDKVEFDTTAFAVMVVGSRRIVFRAVEGKDH